MNFDQRLIDDIVQGVLQQLQPTTTPTASSSSSAPVIENKLWTADILTEAIPTGTRTVRQLPGTIITPSGRDYLRQNGIEVVSGPGAGTKQTAGKSKWKVLVVDSSANFESCWREMNRDGLVDWQRERIDDVAAAAKQTISVLCRAETVGVMVLTREPEQAACLANRNNQVRAVALSSADRWKQLKSSLNPNVVCLDPKQLSYMELRQLWRAIR